jgi:glutamyl-tRNA reductase
VPDERLKAILPEIKKDFGLSEICIISTCNRFEMFGVSEGKELNEEDLYRAYIQIQDRKISEQANYQNILKSNSYIYRNQTAVHHILCVASSLDSLIVGETQITSQFKKSIGLSKEVGCVASMLDRLYQEALACSKKIRRNTAIGEKTVSISHAAIDLAKKIYGEISEQKILIIGAGEMARLAAKYAASYEPEALMIINRTLDKANNLVEEINYGSAHGLDELPTLLEDADIVISSTSATEYVINHKQVASIPRSEDKPLFLCDIAIPRDIDPLVSELEEVFLFEVDDLKQVVNENIEERKAAAKEALKYVTSTTEQFMDWVGSYDIKPILANVKKELDAFLASEYQKTLKKEIFSDLDDNQRNALNSLQESISSKLLGKIGRSISAAKDSDSKYNLIKTIKKLYIEN